MRKNFEKAYGAGHTPESREPEQEPKPCWKCGSQPHYITRGEMIDIYCEECGQVWLGAFHTKEDAIRCWNNEFENMLQVLREAAKDACLYCEDNKKHGMDKVIYYEGKWVHYYPLADDFAICPATRIYERIRGCS